MCTAHCTLHSAHCTLHTHTYCDLYAQHRLHSVHSHWPLPAAPAEGRCQIRPNNIQTSPHPILILKEKQQHFLFSVSSKYSSGSGLSSIYIWFEIPHMFGGGSIIIFTIFAIYMVYMLYMLYVVSVHCREDGSIRLYISEDQKISRGPRDVRPRAKPEGNLDGLRQCTAILSSLIILPRDASGNSTLWVN